MTTRTKPRQRRRLEVLFGGKLPAFTADVSASGLCAEMPQVFLPGSIVDGAVRLETVDYPFRGEVAWAKPGNPMGSVASRIGIRFQRVGDEFLSALGANLRHRVPRRPMPRRKLRPK
ncbi:MAG: PilZ domain-containing protein [Myxococcales bacterium]|nr:PilZ domain-containing protein [Myxococcales bacterium]